MVVDYSLSVLRHHKVQPVEIEPHVALNGGESPSSNLIDETHMNKFQPRWFDVVYGCHVSMQHSLRILEILKKVAKLLSLVHLNQNALNISHIEVNRSRDNIGDIVHLACCNDKEFRIGIQSR